MSVQLTPLGDGRQRRDNVVVGGAETAAEAATALQLTGEHLLERYGHLRHTQDAGLGLERQVRKIHTC